MRLINWATSPTSTITLVRLPDFDMVIDPSDTNIAPSLVKDRVWEPKSTELLKHILRPTDTFVDCGAHWGYYTLLVGKLVGKVYSFEPNAVNFLLLSINVALNNVTNAVTSPMAVWSRTELLPFLMENGSTGGSHVRRSNEECPRDFQKPVYAIASSLDEILVDERVDFIKIDCEGSDHHILKGAEKILKEQHPRVMSEHPFIELLESLGYKQTHEFKDEQTTFWEKI